MNDLAVGKAPIRWLYACLLLVFLMVIVGGLTRLTESGLSIVEWKPVTGALPPLSTHAWEEEFAAYQASPQHQQINRGMTVEQFKNIYWLEYLHRLLGRLTGIVFLLPLAWFSARKEMPRWLGWRMFGVATLVGMQGLAGWLMVKSGLVDDPRVSPLRLALHLGLAIAIFAATLVTLLRLRGVFCEKKTTTGIFVLSSLNTGFLILQMLLGALVAGLDAGLTYNTFPLMDGRFVPEGIWLNTPWYTNLYANIATVQFFHRWWAFAVAGLAVLLYMRLMRSEVRLLQRLGTAIMALVGIQIFLGVATLLYVVPIPLAVMHQATAFLLLGFCIALQYMVYVSLDFPGVANGSQLEVGRVARSDVKF